MIKVIKYNFIENMEFKIKNLVKLEKPIKFQLLHNKKLIIIRKLKSIFVIINYIINK